MKIILGIVMTFAAPLLFAQQNSGADDIPDFNGVWLAGGGGGGAPQGGMSCLVPIAPCPGIAMSKSNEAMVPTDAIH